VRAPAATHRAWLASLEYRGSGASIPNILGGLTGVGGELRCAIDGIALRTFLLTWVQGRPCTASTGSTTMATTRQRTVGGPPLTCKITIVAIRLPKCWEVFSAGARWVIFPTLTGPHERNGTHVRYCPQI